MVMTVFACPDGQGLHAEHARSQGAHHALHEPLNARALTLLNSIASRLLYH